MSRVAAPPAAAAALLLSAALAAAPGAPVSEAAAASGQGREYARPVEVPAAGWVRVPLDLAALRHMGPRRSVRVSGPGGEEVPLWLAPFLSDSERRPARVEQIEEDGKGWTLRLDLGPAPPLHERLFFDFTRLTAAPAVTLEGSRDGKSWEPLVAGDLFRLGEEAGLQRTSLPYPASQLRYLRLAWPRSAGFPQLRGVAVETTVPGRSLAVTSPDAPCRSTAATALPASTVCQLPLPATAQTVRRVILELAGPAAVGYRFYEPRQGSWHLLAQGVWQEGQTARHVIALGAEPLAGNRPLLELFGAAGQPPRLLGHSFDLAVQAALFHADAPGRYTLSYGGAPAPPHAEAAAWSPDTQQAAWIPPGPEEERGAPAAAAGARPALAALAAAAAPGASLATTGFRASWAVAAPAAAAGDLVHLQLPDAVYTQSRPDLGDLRLVAGDRQIPYVRWSPPEPAPVIEGAEVRPEAEKGRHYSRIEVALPAAGLPLTALHLTAPPGPLRRPLGVRYPAPGPPGLAPREERVVARANWECVPAPPLPCLADVPLFGPAPRRLAVRFADGDNPPLGAITMSLWRQDDVLLFIWPGRARVRLLAGAPELSAPVYDLAALGEVLTERPWQSAKLQLSAGRGEGPGPWWNRSVLPATLVVASIFLLLLLRRILVTA
ncbi:MAG TPA: DUF3999 family protein [Thermoanaerobaculia bacterium]|nr:DUF3999 family protein [Thermoanaerobaculia bacterium]